MTKPKKATNYKVWWDLDLTKNGSKNKQKKIDQKPDGREKWTEYSARRKKSEITSSWAS